MHMSLGGDRDTYHLFVYKEPASHISLGPYQIAAKAKNQADKQKVDTSRDINNSKSNKENL